MCPVSLLIARSRRHCSQPPSLFAADVITRSLAAIYPSCCHHSQPSSSLAACVARSRCRSRRPMSSLAAAVRRHPAQPCGKNVPRVLICLVSSSLFLYYCPSILLTSSFVLYCCSLPCTTAHCSCTAAHLSCQPHHCSCQSPHLSCTAHCIQTAQKMRTCELLGALPQAWKSRSSMEMHKMSWNACEKAGRENKVPDR